MGATGIAAGGGTGAGIGVARAIDVVGRSGVTVSCVTSDGGDAVAVGSFSAWGRGGDAGGAVGDVAIVVDGTGCGDTGAAGDDCANGAVVVAGLESPVRDGRGGLVGVGAEAIAGEPIGAGARLPPSPAQVVAQGAPARPAASVLRSWAAPATPAVSEPALAATRRVPTSRMAAPVRRARRPRDRRTRRAALAGSRPAGQLP